LPHTLGHEGSGTVVDIGPGVTKVRPGDDAILTWLQGSGAEVSSTQYRRPDGSAVNSGAVSTFLEHAVVSENRLVRLPGGLPRREAALLGCAVPTGGGVVLNTAALAPGATVAVFGAGGIGLSAIMLARVAQARLIAAVDVLDRKLDLARQLGATHLVHAHQADPVSVLRDLTAGRGVDVAIEAAGRRETMEAALQSVRDAGGLCVIAGNVPAGQSISINPYDLIRGRRLVGTWGGETDPDRDLPRYAELYRSGKLPLEKLIGAAYPLAEINEALTQLESGGAGRVMVRVGEREVLS
jgi:S-(hydroxymethyl)glutathione dehydrogenase/alcohol dehydrogenase